VKQKDLTLIAVVVFASTIVSLVLSRFVFSSPQNRNLTAEKVDVIQPDFTSPSLKYFNDQAVNPTQQIQIGDTTNPNPFNKAQ